MSAGLPPAGSPSACSESSRAHAGDRSGAVSGGDVSTDGSVSDGSVSAAVTIGFELRFPFLHGRRSGGRRCHRRAGGQDIAFAYRRSAVFVGEFDIGGQSRRGAADDWAAPVLPLSTELTAPSDASTETGRSSSRHHAAIIASCGFMDDSSPIEAPCTIERVTPTPDVTFNARRQNPKHWIFKGIDTRTQRGAPEKLRHLGRIRGKIRLTGRAALSNPSMLTDAMRALRMPL